MSTEERSDEPLLDVTTLPSGTPTSDLPPPVVDTRSIHPRRLLSTSRDGGSGRSRSSRRSHRGRSSSSRSRSRRHHSSGRHHSRHRCRSIFKHRERNFAAASCSMIVIVLLCTALVPDWIYLTGGGCRLLHSAESLNRLSTTKFFYNGHFYKHYPLTSENDSIYQFGASSADIMVNCVNYGVVLLFKAVIAFTLIAILCSLLAFLLDLIGPSYHLLRVIRRNAVFNILTVVLCVTINLFCYWIITGVQKIQEQSRVHTGSRIVVTFQAGFYLVTAAGAFSVIATACNCLKRQNVASSSDRQHFDERSRSRGQYYDDMEALLSLSVPYEDTEPPSSTGVLPPAYSP